MNRVLLEPLRWEPVLDDDFNGRLLGDGVILMILFCMGPQLDRDFARLDGPVSVSGYDGRY
jgi:hypothetical protein